MKPVDTLSAWSSHSDLDKKGSDGRDLPQGVAPHAHSGVVGAHMHVGSDLGTKVNECIIGAIWG